MRRSPHFPVARLKALAATPGGLLLRRTSALDYFDTVVAAYDAAVRVLSTLSVEEFSHTVCLELDVADVYGVSVDGAGWYLKVTIDETPPEEAVVVISFHPLARPLRTNRGWVKP